MDRCRQFADWSSVKCLSNSRKNLHVLKYGGSSFLRLQSFTHVARYLNGRLQHAKCKMIVVVSAMSGTTGRLQETALKINDSVSDEILDSLLSTGEIVGACLLRTALEKLNVKTTHLTGFQLGLVTNSNFTCAQVKAFNTDKLLEALRISDVVVVAGGQAINAHGKITMLGRNSSDLSAVLIASALSLSEVEIISDVPGVYSADPYLVQDAKLIKKIPYKTLIAMSEGGAKVLHHGSVKAAKKHGIKIICRSSKNYTIGTIVGEGIAPETITCSSKWEVRAVKSKVQARKLENYFKGKQIIAMSLGELPPYFVCISKENMAWRTAFNQLKYKGTPVTGVAVVTITKKNGYVSRQLVTQEKSLKFCVQKSRSQYSSLLAG